MKARIYLCLQEIQDGRVQFRSWSPDITNVPGEVFVKQGMDAHLWIQRMVYRCAKAGIKPLVKWEEPLPVTQEFLKLQPPFRVEEIHDPEAEDYLRVLRENGFEDASFV
jgi:hypothetical protein